MDNDTKKIYFFSGTILNLFIFYIKLSHNFAVFLYIKNFFYKVKL